jgi:hypothetical protein
MKKRAGGVVQSLGPKLKPCTAKNKIKNKNKKTSLQM